MNNAIEIIEKYLNDNFWFDHIYSNGYPTKVMAKSDFLGMLNELKLKSEKPLVLGELKSGDKFKFLDEEVFLPYEVIERKGITVFCYTPSGDRQYYNAGLAIELFSEGV